MELIQSSLFSAAPTSVHKFHSMTALNWFKYIQEGGKAEGNERGSKERGVRHKEMRGGLRRGGEEKNKFWEA